ncbi:RNA polymerase sigma factor [Haliangium ochraceum]|nr:sigma-70 family RNA polymerase sigma factor [Haliangium ochraceum]
MTRDETDDVELLERWRDGERAAGALLFERYYGPLERFFANKVPGEMGDLVQETFMCCLEAQTRLQDPSKFRSYLFSIAYNVLRGHFRKKQKVKDNVDVDDLSMATLSPGPRSLLLDSESEEQRLLLEGLRNIPAKYQAVLELHYWEGLNSDEIGEVMGTTPAAARGLLVRARAKLEQAISKLTASQAVLDSTLQDLDGWARGWRAQARKGSSER